MTVLTGRGIKLPAVLSSRRFSFSGLPSVCIGVPISPGETQLMRRGASSAATDRVYTPTLSEKAATARRAN